MTDEIIQKFQLGYNLKWDALTKEALKSGYKKEYLEQSGLSIFKEDKSFDRFRGRVCFQFTAYLEGYLGLLKDFKNREKNSKYVNSPESDTYHKANPIWHLFCKISIVKNCCYLVEGYTDVISMYQSGVENVVASSGTA